MEESFWGCWKQSVFWFGCQSLRYVQFVKIISLWTCDLYASLYVHCISIIIFLLFIYFFLKASEGIEYPVKEPKWNELEIMGKHLERGVPWKWQKGDISRRRNWSAVSNGSRRASQIKTESGPLDLMTDLWEDSFNGRQKPDSRGLKSETGRVQLVFQVAWQSRERVTETVATGNIRSSRSSFPWRWEIRPH